MHMLYVRVCACTCASGDLYTNVQCLRMSGSHAAGAGPAVLVSVSDWSPDNRIGTGDFMDGWAAAAAAAGAKVMDGEKPYLQQIASLTAAMDYPHVTDYTLSAVLEPGKRAELSKILREGYENATSPLSSILFGNYNPGDKSNHDTAFAWRGMDVIIVAAYWKRSEGGAAVSPHTYIRTLIFPVLIFSTRKLLESGHIIHATFASAGSGRFGGLSSKASGGMNMG